MQSIEANTSPVKPYTKNGLTWGDGIRMNQVQVVGTHNSYHREVGVKERPFFEKLLASPENYYYSHPSLEIQAEHQQIRNFELDIFADPDGGKYATPLVRKLAKLPFESDPALNQSGTKVLHICK